VVLAALRALASRLARRLGLTGDWLVDRPRPYAIAAPWTSADHAYVQRQAAGFADIVIADYAFQAEALPLIPGRPSAIVMHDLFHARETGAAGRDSVAGIDRETEIALLSQADAVIAIQAAEARFVVEHVTARAILAPMAAEPVVKAQPGERHRLLFVGSNTAPNVVGLEWLFAHVWPLLAQQTPSIMLDVVGSVAGGFPTSGPPGVVFHGQVDAVAPYYARAGIVLSPLTFGSGLKIKLVEALAHGKAIVATGVTLQGVERECESSVVRADDPGDFAAAILALADDRGRASLAEKALETARLHFSPDACHAPFTAWLEENRPGIVQRDRNV
jgi:succinoglycan biosynthesis protein ExoO